MWILSINHVTDVTDRSNSLVVVAISSLPRAFFFTHRIRRGTGQGLWRALGLIRHFLNLVRHQVPNLDIITVP